MVSLPNVDFAGDIAAKLPWSTYLLTTKADICQILTYGLACQCLYIY